VKQVVGIFLVTGLTLIVGCSRSVQLTVVNRSTSALNNVVVSGSGFSQSVGTIPAGEQRQISVQPSGESGVRLVFDANGKHVSAPTTGYFEANSAYKVTATVTPDLQVTVDSKL
jgi:hypothetical protein